MSNRSLWSYYKESLTSKYATFSGRACRKEYWAFVLFHNVILIGGIILLSFIASIVGTRDTMSNGVIGILVFLGVFFLVSIIPNIANSVRRLHDCDQSGWLLIVIILISIIPYIGWIVFIVLGYVQGTKGANRFGDDPLA